MSESGERPMVSRSPSSGNDCPTRPPPERITSAPVVAATRKLGEVLLQEGIRVEARSLLPADALPSIH